VRCWVARSEDRTRVRIQYEPFDFPWIGWELWEGTISQKDAKALEAFPIDPVVLERLHQECFLRARKRGAPVTFGDVPAGPPLDLS
jgi:hypothetical protein